ncbi:MAG: glycosyltransferase family 1 protein, partial [Chloroflexi bacterium]
MRIGYDATPAAVQHAGVGRYARELLRALLGVGLAERFLLQVAASQAQVDQLLSDLPPGAWRDARRLPVSARVTQIIWQRARVPVAVERILGPLHVFHATDFVAPPARAPIVTTIHDVSYLLVPELGHPDLVAYLRDAVPRTLQRAAAIITVSSSVAADLVAAYPAVQHRVVAIPNGVNVPDQVYGERANRPTILLVGTIEPRKNHVFAFHVLQELRHYLPDVRLIVAGRIGWQSEAIVAELRRLVADGLAVFIEQPDDACMARLYQRAHVVIVPSHYEGFGLPVLEAQAHGAPVVASDIPALREAGGQVARYVAPGDVTGFVAELLHLL